MMGISNQDLVFKLKSIGVRVEGDDAHIDTDIIAAILQGKKLPHPREVILRDEQRCPWTRAGRPAPAPAAPARRPAPNPLRPQRPRTLIQKVEPRIQTMPMSERPRAAAPHAAPPPVMAEAAAPQTPSRSRHEAMAASAMAAAAAPPRLVEAPPVRTAEVQAPPPAARRESPPSSPSAASGRLPAAACFRTSGRLPAATPDVPGASAGGRAGRAVRRRQGPAGRDPPPSNRPGPDAPRPVDGADRRWPPRSRSGAPPSGCRSRSSATRRRRARGPEAAGRDEDLTGFKGTLQDLEARGGRSDERPAPPPRPAQGGRGQGGRQAAHLQEGEAARAR